MHPPRTCTASRTHSARARAMAGVIRYSITDVLMQGEASDLVRSVKLSRCANYGEAQWLEYLDTREIVRCSAVCLAFQFATSCSSLYCRVSVVNPRAAFTDAAIDRLIERAGGGLVSLRIISSPDVTSDGLVRLAAQPQLESVDLQGCRGVGDGVIEMLPTSVTAIALRGTVLTERGVKRIEARGIACDPLFKCTECDELESCANERTCVMCNNDRADWEELCATCSADEGIVMIECRRCYRSFCTRCSAWETPGVDGFCECSGCSQYECCDCATWTTFHANTMVPGVVPGFGGGQSVCVECERSFCAECSEGTVVTCSSCRVAELCVDCYQAGKSLFTFCVGCLEFKCGLSGCGACNLPCALREVQSARVRL